LYDRFIIAVLFPKSHTNCTSAITDIKRPILPLPSAPRKRETNITVSKPMKATAVLEKRLDNIPLAKALKIKYY
jgi:hypothetical protein